LHIQGVVEANQTACNGLPTYQVKKRNKKKELKWKFITYCFVESNMI
jgi:hypothetical protein